MKYDTYESELVDKISSLATRLTRLLEANEVGLISWQMDVAKVREELDRVCQEWKTLYFSK